MEEEEGEGDCENGGQVSGIIFTKVPRRWSIGQTGV